MAAVFDDGLLDDADALRRAEPDLRHLAEAGARVRREAVSAADSVAQTVARLGGTQPRAVLAAGPDSRLLRAVLEPVCPVPFVAWPGAGLPGWAGALDLVVVLAPEGSDPATAAGVAEANRRGCPLVVATPEDSLVGRHVPGRDSTLLPTVTGDQLASGIAETSPLLWGGTVLAARAARRVAESVRRSTGRAALAADAEHLLPVLAAAPRTDVFADPFADEAAELRPSLVILDDGSPDPVVVETRGRLQAQADATGVRLETVTTEADGDVARYASLLATGNFAARYLKIGLSG